jgi:hypothetical protein
MEFLRPCQIVSRSDRVYAARIIWPGGKVFTTKLANRDLEYHLGNLFREEKPHLPHIPGFTVLVQRDLNFFASFDRGASVEKVPDLTPGIQLSCLILMEVPEPTPHLRPFNSSSLPNKIEHQVKDAALGLLADRKSVSGKYRPFKTLAHIDDGSVRRRHHCFPSIAWLNRTKSRNPMPPSDFGEVIQS